MEQLSDFIDTSADCSNCGLSGACAECRRCSQCPLPASGFCKGCERLRPKKRSRREWGDSVYVVSGSQVFLQQVVREDRHWGIVWTEIPHSGGQVVASAVTRVFNKESGALALARRVAAAKAEDSEWRGQWERA